MLNAENLSVFIFWSKKEIMKQCSCTWCHPVIHLLSSVEFPILTAVMLETSRVTGQEWSPFVLQFNQSR